MLIPATMLRSVISSVCALLGRLRRTTTIVARCTVGASPGACRASQRMTEAPDRDRTRGQRCTHTCRDGRIAGAAEDRGQEHEPVRGAAREPRGRLHAPLLLPVRVPAAGSLRTVPLCLTTVPRTPSEARPEYVPLSYYYYSIMIIPSTFSHSIVIIRFLLFRVRALILLLRLFDFIVLSTCPHS
jgi:hypothetical protein